MADFKVKSIGWPITLFGAALLLRLAHVATIVHSPFFTRLGLDPLAYDEWGRRIAAGSWLGDRIFYQDPLYPYFLGVVYAAFGHRLLVVTVLQAILGAIVPVLVFRASDRWIGRSAAVAAGWIAALYGPAVYYEGLVLKTWMEAFFMAAALAALSRALVASSPRSFALTGFLFGIGSLARANFLLLVPALGAWILVDRKSRGDREGTRGRDVRPWIPLLAMVAGAGIVVAGSAVRNRVVGGEWVLTTSQAGPNFYLGNNALNRSGEYEPLPFVAANPKHEEQDFAREAERRTGRSMGATEVSRYWFREAFAWIENHPADWMRLTWRKLRVYAGAYEVPDNLDYYLYLETAPVLRLPLPGFGLVAPLGIVGGFLLARRSGWPRALLVVLTFYSASVILFYVFARYRIAMTPVLFPLAGWALTESFRRVRGVLRRKTEPRTLVVLLGGVAAAFAFVHLPVRAPATYWTFRIARAVGLPARPETTATAHYNLGLAYAKEAAASDTPDELLGRAEEELREALRQDPRFAKVHVELGKVLARSGRNREAIEAYEASLRVEPLLWRTHHSLGLLYRRVGDPGRAQAAFRRAAELEPRQADSWVGLGELLLREGRSAEAEAAFRRALDIAPASESARRGLEASGRSP